MMTCRHLSIVGKLALLAQFAIACGLESSRSGQASSSAEEESVEHPSAASMAQDTFLVSLDGLESELEDRLENDHEELVLAAAGIREQLQGLFEWLSEQVESINAHQEQLGSDIRGLEQLVSHHTQEISKRLTLLGVNTEHFRMGHAEGIVNLEHRLRDALNEKLVQLRGDGDRVDAQIKRLNEESTLLKTVDVILDGWMGTNYPEVIAKIETLRMDDRVQRDALAGSVANFRSAVTQAELQVGESITDVIVDIKSSLQDLKSLLEDEPTDSNSELRDRARMVEDGLKAARRATEDRITDLDAELAGLRSQLDALKAQQQQHQSSGASLVHTLASEVKDLGRRLVAAKRASQMNVAVISAWKSLGHRIIFIEENLLAMFGSFASPRAAKIYIDDFLARFADSERLTEDVRHDLTALHLDLFGPDGAVGFLGDTRKRIDAIAAGLTAHPQVSPKQVHGLVALVEEYAVAVREAYSPLEDCQSIADTLIRRKRIAAATCLPSGEDPAVLQNLLRPLFITSLKSQNIAVVYRTRLDALFEQFAGDTMSAPARRLFGQASQRYATRKHAELVQKRFVVEKLGLVVDFLERTKSLMLDMLHIAHAAQSRTDELEDALTQQAEDSQVDVNTLRDQVAHRRLEMQQQMTALRATAIQVGDDLMGLLGLPSKALVTDLSLAMDVDAAVAAHVGAITELAPELSRYAVKAIAVKTAELATNYGEYRQAMVEAANQRESDGWNLAFSKNFYSDSAFIANCGVSRDATFANALGEDAIAHLISQYQRDAIAKSIITATRTRGRLLSGLIAYLIYDDTNAADSSHCLARIRRWTQKVVHKPAMYRDEISLAERFASEQGVRENEALFLRAADENLVVVSEDGVTMDWKKVDDQLPDDELVRSRLAVEFSELGALIAKKNQVERRIVGQLDAVSAIAQNVEAKPNVNQVVTTVNARKAEALRSQVARLRQRLIEARQAVKDLLYRPDRSASEETVDGLAPIISRNLDLRGYLDRRPQVRQHTSDRPEFHHRDFNDKSFYIQPHIHKVQHFFTYPNNGTGTEGIGAGDWNWWSARRFDSLNNLGCSDSLANFDDRDVFLQANTATKAGPTRCWINFRARPLDSDRDRALADVIFRVIGSADVIEVKRSDKREFAMAYGTDPSKQKAQHHYIAQKYALGMNSVDLPELVEARTAPTKAVKVHGSSHIGVFDLYAPQAVLPDKNVRTSYSQKLTFIPIRARLKEGPNLQPADIGYEYTEGSSVDYTVYLYSPLVFDFVSVGPLRTLSTLSGVRFDLDADGHREATGWVAGNRGAFLALDLNGNGVVDHGGELFGQATALPDGSAARHGYQALAKYDLNDDRCIDSRDPIFDQLLFWFDHDGNGRSELVELHTLAEMQVHTISLEYETQSGRDQFDNGNLMKYRARFKGPSSCPSGGCFSYDVFFGVSRLITTRNR